MKKIANEFKILRAKMNTLASSIIVYGAVNALKSLVPFLMLPLMTSYLSKSEYGILSLLEVVILFTFPFIGINVNGAFYVVYCKQNIFDIKDYLSSAFFVNILSFLLLLVISIFLNPIISEILDLPICYLNLVPFFCLSRIIVEIVQTYYQVSLKPLKYGVFTLSEAILDIVISFIFVVLLKYGIAGRLYGIYLPFTIFSILGFFLLKKNNLLGLNIKIGSIKHFLGFGLPLIPHALGATIIAMSDRFFISNFIGNDKVGIYSVSYQIGALMLLFGTSINQAWTPILFRKLAAKKYKQIKLATLALLSLLIFSFCIILLLRDLLFNLFVDKEFFEAKLFFFPLLFGFFIQSVYFLFTNILFFYEKSSLLAKYTFMGAILNIILNYFFINYFGIIGVAYSTVLTWCVFLSLVIYTSLNLLENEK